VIRASNVSNERQVTATDALPAARSTSAPAFLVAAGIFLSRIFGLIRVRVFSHYFGLQSDAADAFNAAFRIPNFLQNLFGEGALSASFIPVYARLLAEGRHLLERYTWARAGGEVLAALEDAAREP